MTEYAVMPKIDYQAACDAIRIGNGGTIPIKSGEMSEQIRHLTDNEDALITRETVGEYRNDRVITIGMYAFASCRSLTTVNFPAVRTISVYAFWGCTALTTINLPSVMGVSSNAFAGCTSLVMVDLPAATTIANLGFNGCSGLKALILRNKNCCALSNANAFNGTLIASGTGHIYVPAALMDSYKEGTGWSTYAAQFRALEDYTVDGTTTGALDETRI